MELRERLARDLMKADEPTIEYERRWPTWDKDRWDGYLPMADALITDGWGIPIPVRREVVLRAVTDIRWGTGYEPGESDERMTDRLLALCGDLRVHQERKEG